MKMTTTCDESLIASGWTFVARFHDNDDALRYRRRIEREGKRTHLHNCPQDHGNPEGAWAVWEKAQ